MRKLEAAIAQRGLDAFAAFLDGIVGQADDVEVLHAGGADVDFHLDEVSVDAVDRSALCFEEHTQAGLIRRGQHKSIRYYTPEIIYGSARCYSLS